jgi:hypothetical protein
MIDLVVRSFIGVWGGRVLDFYLEYSLWINGILFLLFVLIVLGRRNYDIILNSLVANLRGEHASRLKGKNPGQIQSALKKIDIPWQAGLKASAFPFVTPPGAFRPYVKSENTLQKIFTNEILADKLIQTSE